MKKFFCFILAFVFIFPLTFTLAGCFNQDPNNSNTPNNPNTPTIKVKDINELCLSLEDKNFPSNFSFNEDFNFTKNNFDLINNQESNKKTNSKDISGIKFNASKDVYSLFVPDAMNALFYKNQDIIVKKGKAVARYLSDNSKSPCVYNYLSQLHKGTLYTSIINLATTLKDCKATCKIDENNNYNLLISFNLKNVINDSLSSFFSNRNKDIKTMINEIFFSLTNKEINIVDYINEFKNTFTDETTVADLLSFASRKTGFKFEEIFKFLINAYNLSNVNKKIYAQHTKFDNYPDYEIENSMFNTFGFVKTDNKIKTSILSKDFLTYDNIKIKTLTSLFNLEDKPQDKTNKDYIFEKIENTLCSSEISLDSLNSKNGILNKDYASFVSKINGVFCNKLILTVNCILDSNLKTKNVDLTFDYNISKFTDEISKTGSGCSIVAQAFVKCSDSIEENIPPLTYTSYESLITIILDTSKIDLKKLYFGILFPDLKLPVKDFKVGGDAYYPDCHIHESFVICERETKNIIFLSEAVKYGIDNNYDLIEYSTQNENKEKITIRLMLK